MKNNSLFELVDKFAATADMMTLPAEDLDTTLPGIQSIDPVVNELKNKYPRPWLDDKFWTEFIAMCKRLGADPKNVAKVIRSESNFDPKAIAKDPKDGHAIAKGLNQLIRSTAVSMNIMTKEQWEQLETVPAIDQLKYVEAYFGKVGIKGMSAGDIYAKNFGGLNYEKEGNKILYMSKAYMDAHQNDPYIKSLIDSGKAAYQEKAYQSNKALDKDGKGFISKKDLTKLVGG